MSERIAVVCARKGVDPEAVTAFMEALWARQPDSVVISGGANPEKLLVEDWWLKMGGPVVSWRPKMLELEKWAIQRWQAANGRFYKVYLPPDLPTFMDFKSAANARNLLIAEECQRCVAFYGEHRSRGAGFTAEMAGNWERDVYEYFNEPEERP